MNNGRGRFLAPEKLTAVVGLLEVMLDPVARTVAAAPLDTEPLTAGEQRALVESRDWLNSNRAIAHAHLLNKLGITQEEIECYLDPA